MKILNLTQHVATSEQVKAGVVEPVNKGKVKELLTFDEIPSSKELVKRAKELATLASSEGAKMAMIGGAPFFMAFLEIALVTKSIRPLFAFSKRESIEETQEDGTVIKKAVFRHAGFVGLD